MTSVHTMYRGIALPTGRWLIATAFAVVFAVAPCAANEDLEAQLVDVQSAIAALPVTGPTELEQRRQLLERIELSISRQLAADAATARARAQRDEIVRQLDAPVGEVSATLGPEAIDRLLADAVTAQRNATIVGSAVDMIRQQEQDSRARLDAAQAADRALAEASPEAVDARELSALRVRSAATLFTANGAELASAQAASNLEAARALLARNAALAASPAALDLAAMDAYFERLNERSAAIALSSNDILHRLAERQLELAAARRARDEVQEGDPAKQRRAQWRVDEIRSAADRDELELRKLRVELEAVQVASDLWQHRRDAMVSGSMRSLPKASDIINTTRTRTEVASEYIRAVVSRTRNQREVLAAEAASLDSDDPGRAILARQDQALLAIFPIVERIQEDLVDLDTFIDSSEIHLEYLAAQQSLLRKLDDVWSVLSGIAKSIWSFELFTVEDSIDVDGKLVTGRLGITVEKVATALLLLTLGVWVASLIGVLIRKLLIGRGVSATAAALSYRLINLIAILVLIVIAFSVVNIPLTVFGFVGGAVALGVGLGAQQLVNNFISGVILLVEQPIRIGDTIELDRVRGTVQKIAARYSQVRRFDGVDMLIPNSELLERRVINLTLEDPDLRLSIKVGVAYGSPPRDASRCILAAAEDHGVVLKQPPPYVLFEDFGDSALIFSVYFWVRLSGQSNSMVTMSDLRYMIERNLNEAGIVIAFPQKDVHLDVKGPVSVRLSDSSAASAV